MATEHDDAVSSLLDAYGALVIVGHNGALPGGNRGRMRSKYVLKQRPLPDGAKMSGGVTEGCQPAEAAAPSTAAQNRRFDAPHALDEQCDTFQIGRSPERVNDFVVIDVVREKNGMKVLESSVSRFACRILASRSNPKIGRIFAGGFDSCGNVYLGDKAIQWQRDGTVDGLTTNGVLLAHPQGSFCGGEVQPGIWREVSVNGDVFSLRKARSAKQPGEAVQDETNVLRDGSLIDLCGVTLVWRSAEALAVSATTLTLESLVNELNAGRPQCPMGLNTLHITRKASSAAGSSEPRQRAPYVYLRCGHVLGRRGWDEGECEGTCPVCLAGGGAAELRLGNEPAFYVDADKLSHAFSPCGHMTTEKTAKFWASVPIPRGANGFEAVCPFCGVPLCGFPGYVRLVF